MRSPQWASSINSSLSKERNTWKNETNETRQRSLLTTVYNCAQIKLTTPRYGGSLWEMVVSISTGDGHDQEEDSEYHTRISKPGQGHSRHRHHIWHSQENSAQIPAPPGTRRHAPPPSPTP